MINVDLKYTQSWIKDEALNNMEERIKTAHKDLKARVGKGSEFLGWLDLPTEMETQLDEIEKVAKDLQAVDVLLVVGIGGSYLGAKAALEALNPYFGKQGPEIIFVGHHISSAYMLELKRYLSDKSFAINVISKSGTTTEPAIAFRVFKALLEEKVGLSAAKDLIVATTDESKGALRHLADEVGYRTFVIPDNVGGRYSIFTAVGLLPIAVSGIDIKAMLSGAKTMMETLNEESMSNPMYQYVAARNYLYGEGKKIEMFVHYDPKMQYLAEWWKQLFGESEGKDGKGIFVASAGFTTDLHSLGQYIQDGERHLFETVINIKTPTEDFTLEANEDDLDGLNYLAGTSVDEVNKQAMLGTLLAHNDGGVPNIVINLDQMDASHFGALIYFYELSCAVSGYVLGVNPFDQPGVEAYKKNMFALLEKPGFEEATKAIKKRIK